MHTDSAPPPEHRGAAGPDGFPAFAWAIGEEGSDPIVTVDGRPFRHDQFAQSGHYDNQDADLAAIASLGADVVRYGMPWRLTEPEPGRYDWSLWDRALASCERAGLWLEHLASGLQRLRADGRPVRGLCWYSRGDQYDWQTALANPTGAVTEVGLCDTDRRARPVADAFRGLATRSL